MKTPFALSALGFTLSLWHLMFMAMGVFFAIDCFGRYKEYRRVRGRLIAGTDNIDSLIERKRGARCTREVLVAAAKVVDRSDYVRLTYYDMGYRWYHITPDWLWKEPQ